MKPRTEADLILYYYGEAPDAAGIERRLGESPRLRSEYDALCRALDAIEEGPLPVLPASYEAQLWSSLEGQLGRGRQRAQPALGGPLRHRWALVGAMATLVVAAFVAGRYWPDREIETASVVAQEARQRILLMAVADHLQRSEVLLLELVNARDDGEVDLSVERQLASTLRDQNRLYRRAAAQAGEVGIAVLLDQLERWLVETANGPPVADSPRFRGLRRDASNGDLLFRVRVVESRLRSRILSGSQPPDEPRPARDL